jgi:hypothetical protein
MTAMELAYVIPVRVMVNVENVEGMVVLASFPMEPGSIIMNVIPVMVMGIAAAVIQKDLDTAKTAVAMAYTCHLLPCGDFFWG